MSRKHYIHRTKQTANTE